MAPWHDDIVASSPDWHTSSKEAVLKQSHLWHPREDAWLRDKKTLSASDRAHKSMDLYLQCNHEAELRELPGAAPSSLHNVAPASHADSATDPKTLCAWVAKSMPPLSWPPLEDDWDRHFGVFFSRHRPRIPPPPPSSPSWSPPLNVGCRHPDDHVIVASPCLPVQGDGRCFLRSTPTFFRPRAGSSWAPRTRALLDNCANLCLVNKALIMRCIPSTDVHDEFTTGVDGIGSARTVGSVHDPIYVDCMSRIGGKIGKVELNLEIHLIQGLPVDLIVGMDAICAYGIDTIVSRSLATLSLCNRDLAFPIKFRRLNGMRDPASPDGFPVVFGADVVVPPSHEAPVSVITGIGPLRGDAWLHPVQVKNDNRLWSPLDGGWVAGGLMCPGHPKPHVLFANMSTRSLRLRRGQMIGRHTLCGTHDCFGASTITHSPAAAVLTPSVFSCVPKRHPQGGLCSFLSNALLSPPCPTSLMDPHNRDPPAILPAPDSAFDMSPNCKSPSIAQVLEAHRSAFSFDGVLASWNRFGSIFPQTTHFCLLSLPGRLDLISVASSMIRLTNWLTGMSSNPRIHAWATLWCW